LTLFGHINPLYSLSGFLVGMLVGITGVGGGSLMTPLLVLLFGIHPATAVGTDLLYAACTKSVGTVVHGLKGSVQWPIVGLLAAGSLPATVLTLAGLVHFGAPSPMVSRLISFVLGSALLLTAVSLLFHARILAWASSRAVTLSPSRARWLTVATGLALGVLVAAVRLAHRRLDPRHRAGQPDRQPGPRAVPAPRPVRGAPARRHQAPRLSTPGVTTR